MRGDIYTEFIENGDHRITVGMPGPGKAMTLTWSDTGDVLRFTGRKACLRWLVRACPDANAYASDGRVTLCAGTVRYLADRAGVKVPVRKVS